MTARSRQRAKAPRMIDRLWAELIAGPGRSCAVLAGAIDAPEQSVRNMLALARHAGLICIVGSDTDGTAIIPRYALAPDAPPLAPRLRRDEAGRPEVAPDSGVPGAALAALRARHGWSLAQAGRAIEIKDTRTVRRYLIARDLPPRVAAIVTQLTRAENA
jgi:hypothetical protein